MVYLPTGTLKINQMYIVKYTRPMDPMGYVVYHKISPKAEVFLEILIR